MYRNPFTSFIITAAGASRRMGKDKIFARLCGFPAVYYALSAAQKCEFIDEIIVSSKKNDIGAFWKLAQKHKLTKLTHVVCGGATRQESVAAAVSCINENSEYIAVHDGARPLVTPQLIANVCLDAHLFGAAVPAVPLTDTIKEKKGGFIKVTLNRENIIGVQTPQVFSKSIYKKALELSFKTGLNFTDDSQLMESFGQSVYLSTGDRHNIKLTFPEDLIIAQLYLENFSGSNNTERNSDGEGFAG